MLNEIEQFKKIITNSKHILVVFSDTQNIDSITSALALKNYLTKLNKQVDVACPNYKKPKNLKFIENADDVKKDLGNLQKLIIKVDGSKAKLETLSYDLKKDLLSIYLSPSQGQITKNDLRTAQTAYKYDLVITINTQDLDSLGEIFFNNTDLFYRLPIVNIDNQASNEHYGQINIVDLTSTSSSEILYKILKKKSSENIDETNATNLLTGIISKTQSFKTGNVTPNLLNLASDLIGSGANRDNIIQHLYRTKSIATLKLWGKALTHLKNDDDIGLVWSTLTKGDFVRSDATDEDLKEIIEELISNSPQAKIILLLYENDNGNTNGVINTNKDYDAKNLVAEYYPKGHKDYAKFEINLKLNEAEKEIIENIKKQAV